MAVFPPRRESPLLSMPIGPTLTPCNTPSKPPAMSEPRVKAGIWVQIALRLGNASGRYGAVLRRGDADAGGVLVVLRGRDGLSVLSQTRGADGSARWLRATGPGGVPQEAADAYVERQLRHDPDLWVLEFESPDLLPPFEANVD
jgi:hypothetical protein